MQHSILIVDDNPSNLKLLYDLLSTHDYQVRVANVPQLGLESAITTPPDIILLDIRMPGMDGYTLCRELRKNPKTQSIPVIFISASEDALDKVKAFEVGGMDYISKPFDSAEVFARIKNHLQLNMLQQQIQQSLYASQNILQAFMDNSPAIIYIKDREGKFLQVNREFERFAGLRNEEIIGKTGSTLFSLLLEEPFSKYDHEVLENSQSKQYEETLEFAEGAQVFLSIKFPLNSLDGSNFAICGISTEITERKRVEAELEHLAAYDMLTDLPNRSLFMGLLSKTLSCRRQRKFCHALLFIDLDNFKNVNDSLGHYFGDELLKGVAKRLLKCIRNEDTVSRIGGDEFVILLQGINNHSDAADVSNKIIAALESPFEIESKSINTSASIGIVIFPDNGTTAETLLRKADTAMYHAKSCGRNTFQFYNEEMNRRVLERMQIEKELRASLQEGTIRPFYQPKVETKTGEFVGVEVLSRWYHPEMGEISPSKFIPVAEESDLIILLDRYMLRTTIEQFSPLVNNGTFTGLVSINLSAHHFFRDNLCEYIDELLNEFNFPAVQLDLEITEGTLMKDTQEAIRLMQELRKRGVQLSIDDFGTGYSSLSYLKLFPVNTLKIDISFIRDLNKSDVDRKLVASIINLAHGQNLSCVAEGVETQEQSDILDSLDCELLQGYLFSPAVDFETICAIFGKDELLSQASQ